MRIGCILLGLLLLVPVNALALMDNIIEGDCNAIISGDNNQVILTCNNTTIPQPALDTLQKRLDDYFQEQLKLLSTAEGTQELIADLQQQIKGWMKRYHELAANIEEGPAARTG